jgi:putative salt-induced outer membrane protein YdiY
MSLFGVDGGRSSGFGAILVGLVTGLFVAGPAVAEGDVDWTGDVSLSVTSQSGTTDTFAGALDAKTKRASEQNHLKIRFKADYGTSKKKGDGDSGSETIQDSQALFGEWKRTIHDRFFWDSGSETSRDSTQDRDIRVAVDTGPGYRVWRSNDEGQDHFDLMGGVGYRYEVYDSDDSHFVDLVGSFEYKNGLFDDKVEFTHTGTVKAPANEFSDFIVSSEVIIGVPLTESWSFRTSVFVEYVNEVPTGIEEFTTKTSVGLGYKF